MLATRRRSDQPRGITEPRSTLDRLFDRFFDDAFARSPVSEFIASGVGEIAVPPMDIYEEEGAYHVELAVPGLKKENIDIEAKGDRLVVSGHREEERREDGARYHYREMRRGGFSRIIELPTEVEDAEISAIYDGGILNITVRPTQPIEGKRIAIN
jgi:HSP20 family protein